MTLKAKVYPEVLRPVIGFTDRAQPTVAPLHSESPYRVPAGDAEPIPQDLGTPPCSTAPAINGHPACKSAVRLATTLSERSN
ncbi:hypothetical protein [Kribbella sp. NPDC000426]|uniref:hypothetical protein n=1 Tax=Kribbella sp. NPDC000426 TaxID=3154255 RepID=UPI003325B679